MTLNGELKSNTSSNGSKCNVDLKIQILEGSIRRMQRNQFRMNIALVAFLMALLVVFIFK